MKIDYNYLFSEYSPYELIPGCSLTRGYVRFLLHMAAGYHTFWSDGERVTLSDTEKQLIEQGNSVLTGLYADGCQMDIARVVGLYTLSSPLTVASGVVQALTWTPVFEDNAYIRAIAHQLVCYKNGYYVVHATARYAPAQPDNQTVSIDFRYNKNGGADNQITYSTWVDGLSPTMNITAVNDQSLYTGLFYMRLAHGASVTFNIDSAETSMRVLYFG